MRTTINLDDAFRYSGEPNLALRINARLLDRMLQKAASSLARQARVMV